MKLTITTSPKNVEMANYILGHAIKSLRVWPDPLDIKPAEIEAAETFRKAMLKAFLRSDEKEGITAALDAKTPR